MIAVLSSLISKKFEQFTGIRALPLKPFSKLDLPVSTHADMLLCVLDNRVFCYKDYFFDNVSLFEGLMQKNYQITIIDKDCKKKYPNDIALNVLVIGKTLFCNEKYTANEILTYAKDREYKIINVKQGYSACSTFVIDKKHAITADMGMKRALEKENIDVTLISNEGIKLDGYNYGFIGGSGVIIDDTAYFFGNIKTHPDFEKIRKALDNKNIKIFSILPNDVYDFGGIKLFWMYIW